MSLKTFIISDLHLCDEAPHLMALFRFFMEEIAPNSDQLFILGDLFEVWIGDDYLSNSNREVISLLRNYTDNGKCLFFLHGNRDFLIGLDFAKMCGANLLPENYLMKVADHNILLMHGDSLCTDDVDYQKFRHLVRSAEWQKQFLAHSIEQRLSVANDIRSKSKVAQSEKAYEIMDVNQKTVIETFKQNQCDWIIHGHTHREAIHQLSINNKPKKRVVLSDWNEKGHYLSIVEDQIESRYFRSN